MATYRVTGLTHIVEINPKSLKAQIVNKSGRVLAKKIKNFINGNFFIYGKPSKTIGWLISKGKVLSERHEYKTWKGNPKGTLIVYKNGRVEVGLKYDKEIAENVKKILFCCQGFNLMPLDIAKEGFDPDEVGYACNRVAIGYREKDNKIVIAVRPSSNAARAKLSMQNLECSGAICLDSGGSTNLIINGKMKFATDRILNNIVYW